MTAETEVLEWQDGKRAAVSLTYDDGSITQFRVALPLMNERGLVATFFIITGEIPGSTFKPTYLGKPVQEVIAETASVPTSRDNLFERASAIRSSGFEDTRRFHEQAGELFEQGKVEQAYRVIDEAFSQIREGRLQPVAPESDDGGESKQYAPLSWEELRTIAGQGHEFASHTVSHPYLSVLTEENLLYELERSREEILSKLGPKHTFSIECPYGTEDERVMKYALARYPLSRNRLSDEYVEELNRWNDKAPGLSKAEYVQWQRGPHTDTPLRRMKGWIDEVVRSENIWLVLVFHGVDGVGWQAKPKAELEAYFDYIKSKEDLLWVATFQDVGKYMRERMHAEVRVKWDADRIQVRLTHTLDAELYDVPLTLKTHVPDHWSRVVMRQGTRAVELSTKVEQQPDGRYVIYRAYPNSEVITLQPGGLQPE